MKFLIPVMAASAVTALATAASAQCVTVDPVLVPQVRVDPLDATGPAELVQPFVLNFRRAGASGGPIMVRFQIVDEDSSVQSRVGQSQGPTVEWTGSDSSRDIGAFRSEAYGLLRTSQAVLGDDDAVAQRQVSLRLTDLRADLPAGVYREHFTVRYWCEDGDSTLPYESTGAVSVSVAVPNVLSASVAGASIRGEIDFLDFAMRSRSLMVSVRSTGPYRVTARSENGGVMVRDGAGAAPGAADLIQYQASFDGQPLDLDSGSAQPLPRAGLGGRQMPLEVQVDSVDRNRAGSYADTLYLTLSPAN